MSDEEFLQQIAEARAMALEVRDECEASGPPCSDCRYSEVDAYADVCAHPVFWEMKYDRVTGSVHTHGSMSRRAVRSDNGLCGLGAALFEPLTFAQWFWRRVIARVLLACAALFVPAVLLIAFLAGDPH